ncbi:TetR/AcrR family transcriptional regulator C-terminal domain-containing protein [Actinoplanes sp. CA-054009]
MESPPRRRGRPPRIDRARIVAVARRMDPATLTMQAVADELGVDRKALNYHVTDREGLLELVAFDKLQSSMDEIELPADWRAAVRVFATTTRDGMVRTGALFDYVKMSLPTGLSAMQPAERFLQVMVGAGFTPHDASRALAFIAEMVYASARDTVLIERYAEHPQVTELKRMLDQAPPESLPMIRALSGVAPPEDQFEFDLRVCVAGLATLLEEEHA